MSKSSDAHVSTAKGVATTGQLKVMQEFTWEPPKPINRNEAWRPVTFVKGAVINKGHLPEDYEADLIDAGNLAPIEAVETTLTGTVPVAKA